MYIKNKKGQSTVEYVLLVTAVVAVVIGFTAGQGGGGLQNQLNTTLNTAAGDINAELLANSHQASTSPAGSTEPPISIDMTNGLQTK